MEWCSDSLVALERDAVTVEFGDEPGAAYRLHPTTGGVQPIPEEGAAHGADTAQAHDGAGLPPCPTQAISDAEVIAINTTSQPDPPQDAAFRRIPNTDNAPAHNSKQEIRN